MTAQINGQPWTAPSTSRTAQLGSFGTIFIQGSQNGTTIVLTLYNIDSIGTYSLGMGATTVGGVAQVTDIVPRSWATPASGAAGTVTITTLTTGHIAGSFAFSADSILGTATGTTNVTQGSFDLLLGTSGTTTWPLPDNYGSTIRGTVGGSPSQASLVVSTLLAGTMVIGASNTSYSLSIGQTGFTGVGSYPVSATPGEAVVVLQGPAANPTGPLNCCWGGTTGNVGTLTITSLTATRLKGTLSATLVPTPGATAVGTIVIADTFDIGLP